MYSVLVIDDERAIRRALKDILELENYTVFEATDGKDGINNLKDKNIDLIFCDIKMPQIDGIEFLSKYTEFSSAPVVMISGHGTIETAVECLKKGAVDYIEKPLDLTKVLNVAKANINKNPTQIPKTIKQQKQIKAPTLPSHTVIVGQSEAIKKMLSMIDRVAPTDAKVLITGGNGTGKELVAKMLFEKSLRNKNPFV